MPTLEDTGTSSESIATNGKTGVLGDFGIRGDMLGLQLFNFLVVMVILWHFAYKPIVRLLAEREHKLAESLKQAELIEKRLAELDREREQILLASRAQAKAIVERALVEVETRKQDMIASATREVERVVTKGKQQLEAEHAAMLIAARKDLVDIAVKAAAKIMTESLTDRKSQSLAEEMVRKLT